MERRHSATPPREDVYDAGSICAEPEKMPGASVVSWGCYSGGAAVDALIGYLNPVGLREGALKRVRPLHSLVPFFGKARTVCSNRFRSSMSAECLLQIGLLMSVTGLKCDSSLHQ